MIAGEAAVISDIYQDRRVPYDAYKPTFVRSLAMVPVPQDDPIAAMGAYWAEVREISREELNLLQGIANTAALAVAAIESSSVSQKKVEESSRQKPLVARELNHRIKNLLTLVEALIGQTADSASSLEEFRDVFQGRLRALARAQARLLEGTRSDVDLHDLVAETVTDSGVDIRHEEPEQLYEPILQSATRITKPFGCSDIGTALISMIENN